jgi:hypothetical protein
MVIAVILGATLAFEHFPHLVYYLLNAGALALLGFFPHRRRSTIFRSGVVITLTIALALPFILLSWNLAKAYGYDTDLALLKKVSGYLRLGGFFIVHPRSLVGGLKGGLRGLFVILSFVFIGRYRQRFWSEDIVRLLIISPALVVFIALNPFLVPVLSRLLAPQTIMRLRQAMVIWVLGSLSYGVTRAGLRIRTHWRHRDRWTVWQLASIVLMALLIIGSATSLTLDAAYVKVKNVVYGPGNATLIPSERVIRRMIEAELEDPPHPILIPPARLAQYLDADILAFIRRNMPADSIFLAERLTECYLPAYADQLAYLGRPGWPGSGDICPRVRNEGAKAAFPLLNKPEVVFERLDVACNILDPNADPDEIETLLIANQSEIDYILVTPNTDYLKGKLDQIMPSARVYTGDGFMIYALSELDGSK